MKKVATPLLMLLLGLAAGAGGGSAVALLLPPAAPSHAPVQAGDSRFVTLGALLVPVLVADRQLTAYASVEAQLEVGADDEEGVTARIPLVIHAVNVRLYRTALGSGPDGRLPDASAIRTAVAEEAQKVLGPGVVRSVALTRLAPA